MRACARIGWIASLVVAAGVGSYRPALAQSDTETACRASIAGSLNSYVGAVFKTASKCHKQRSAGKLALSVDCNDIAKADPAKKLEGRRKKARKQIAGPGTPCRLGGGEVLLQYARCPSPAAASDDGPPTDGIDSFDELAECLIGLADALVGHASARAMGLPADVLGADLVRCQQEIGKRLAKLIAAYGKGRRQCQQRFDVDRQGLGYGCSRYDGRGRIAKARAKLVAGMRKRCDYPDQVALSAGNETLDTLGACGDTLGQLERCVADVAGARLGAGLIAAAYELPADCRAGGMVRTFHASVGTRLAATSLSAGSNGVAHGIDFNDLFRDPLTLDCDADCAHCSIGFNTSKAQIVPPCRCDNDVTVACDTLDGPDLDDCGLSDRCSCYFGPVLPVSASGAPVCVPIRLTADYAGSADLGTGEWDSPLQVAAVIHLGGTQDAPCPRCDGDSVRDDGVRGGRCSAGLRAGRACDTNGIHPTWGAMSIDCQPLPATNISGEGLLLNFPLMSSSSILPAMLPCDDPEGALCPCRVCSDNSAAGCRNDQECIDADAGICTGTAGAGVTNNDCNDKVCTPKGSTGECDAGPVDSYCDGAVHPSGRGYLSCQADADCQVQGAGTCTIEERRKCFYDPIGAHGRPGVFGSEIGGMACLGATNSAAINVAAGLPGPVRAIVEFDADPTCAADPTVVWELPGGSNCQAAAGGN